ncbi:MAG TPA: hypothetical protein VFS67_10080 [Polyangiaceae bacterium]|nr:hypothetical protein [Polyangiaceae bacterium]
MRHPSATPRRSRALLLSVCVAAFSSPSAAQPPAEPSALELSGSRSAAFAHYQEGVRLYDAGAFAPALRQFEHAYRLSGNYQLLFNIAQLRYGLGQLELARQALERYAQLGAEQLSEPRRQLVARQLRELKRDAPRGIERRAEPAHDAPSSATDTASIVAWTSAGALGLAAAGTGLATLLTSRQYDRLRSRPIAGSAAHARERLDAQRSLVRHLAIASDLLAAASVASAAAGVYFHFHLDEAGAPQRPLAFEIGPGELRVVGRF